MAAGSLSSRLAKASFTTLFSALPSFVRLPLVSLLSLEIEVGVFRSARYLLSTPNEDFLSSQSWIRESLHFACFKGVGNFLRTTNPFFRHCSQNFATMLGDEATSYLHLTPQVSEGLLARFVKASATNLSLELGSKLFANAFGGSKLSSIERNLDCASRFREISLSQRVHQPISAMGSMLFPPPRGKIQDVPEGFRAALEVAEYSPGQIASLHAAFSSRVFFDADVAIENLAQFRRQGIPHDTQVEMVRNFASWENAHCYLHRLAEFTAGLLKVRGCRPEHLPHLALEMAFWDRIDTSPEQYITTLHYHKLFGRENFNRAAPLLGRLMAKLNPALPLRQTEYIEFAEAYESNPERCMAEVLLSHDRTTYISRLLCLFHYLHFGNGARSVDSLWDRIQTQLYPKAETVRNYDIALWTAEALGILCHERIIEVEKVWPHLGTRRIEFLDGGDSYSTLAFFMRGYHPEDADCYTLPLCDWQNAVEDIRILDEAALPGILRRYGATGIPRVIGRSQVFGLQDGRHLVVKPSRDGRIPEQSTPHDRTQHSSLREIFYLSHTPKKEWNLESEYPEVVTDESGRPIVIEGHASSSIVFITPAHYYAYLRKNMDAETLDAALERSLHDIFTLARHKLFHTVPSSLFHNEEKDSDQRWDSGTFTPIPDLMYPEISGAERRTGMGRLNAWPRALENGNMGMTGLRDLEEVQHFRTHEEIARSEAPLSKLIAGQERSNYLSITDNAYLGNALLTASIQLGEQFATGEAGTSRLLRIFSSAYAARHQISRDEARAILLNRVSWNRFAIQLKIFMSHLHAYYLRPGAKVSDFPTELLYGSHVTIASDRLQESCVSDPSIFGYYRPGSFHPRFGFLDPDGNPLHLSLGPVNGPFPVREFERAMYAVFIPPPHAQ